jgi:pimeloyl-ACP methyl ester carboxylesterase
VLLLHGWPYDIHTYAEVTPLLAAAGYRVILPYLRGYGTTRFLSDGTLRNGQQAVFALDMTRCSMRSASARRSSAAAIGAPGPPASWPRSGLSAAARSSRSAAT